MSRCTVSGCPEPRLSPRSLCRGHWNERRRLSRDPERENERRRKYRHTPAARAAQKRYRARHREQHLEATRRWRESNREKLLARRREQYAVTRPGFVAIETSGS